MPDENDNEYGREDTSDFPGPEDDPFDDIPIVEDDDGNLYIPLGNPNDDD